MPKPKKDARIAIEHVEPGSLAPADYNPRAMDEDARRRLERSVREFGMVDPIIARRHDRLVIGGHQRLAAATAIGLASVPVVFLDDISDQKAAALNVALNNRSAQGAWDYAKLSNLLSELDANGFDATLTGFDDEELRRLLAPAGGLLDGTDPDEVPDPPAKPITKPGDLITLGRHRLVCGDSTDAGAWEALLSGCEVGMVWTDPPYGVSYQANESKESLRARNRRTDGLVVENDTMDAGELREFLQSVFSLAWAACNAGASWYVAAPAGPLHYEFATVLRDLAVWRHTLTWLKDQFVFGRSDYHYRHEPIFYGWKEGAAHTWNGGRSQDSVLEIPRPRASKEHPTMKPVALIQRCIENSSNPSDTITDPFGGSGSTLLAAEATGRASALIELSPAYCDVIVTRWENATGQKAVRP